MEISEAAYTDALERIAAAHACVAAWKQPPPEPPAPQGPAVTVTDGAKLPAALAEALPGTTILLPPDLVYAGDALILTGRGLTIRCSVDLAAGRIDLTTPLPRILAPVHIRAGAEGLTFLGIEHQVGATQTAVSIGTDTETDIERLPDNITHDRCRILADPSLGAKRGVAANGRKYTCINSHLGVFWQVGTDTQAIAAWNGVGPYWIENNYLAAAGENVMLGGADSRVPGDGPKALTMRRNWLHKPEWLRTKRGTVKNIFELKNCVGFVVTENILEGCWTDSQTGSAVLMTPRNQGGTRPDSTVTDGVFSRNVILNVEGNGIVLQGFDDEKPSTIKGRNVDIEDNIIASLKSAVFISRGWDGLRIRRNTAPIQRSSFLAFSAPAAKLADGTRLDGTVADLKFLTNGLEVVGNLADGGSYVISGSGFTPGLPTLQALAPGYAWGENVIERSESRGVSMPTGTQMLPAGTLAVALDAHYEAQAYEGSGAPKGLMAALESVRVGR
jgi:hypothetical protein